MPYTKIKLTTEGIIAAIVTCDLETGWMTAVNESTRWLYTAGLSECTPLRSSPNLLERRVFETVLGRLSDRLSAQSPRKRMKKGVRTELFNLINDPNLKRREPQYDWGRRDGWYVWITLDGEGVLLKTLGPFGFVDEGSKAERVISLASEDWSLFFHSR